MAINPSSRGSLPINGSTGGAPDWKLPRGPHDLPREVIVEHQRRRLLAAAARALDAHGYPAMTVEHILADAGVSRTTFYENFGNKRECVLVAHEEAFDRFVGALFHACAEKSGWPAKVAAAIRVAVELAIRSPGEARLLFVDAVAAEPVLVGRVLASNDFFVALLRKGRDHCAHAATLPEATERALIGATASVIGARLIAGQKDGLAALEPQLVHLILMPYLGREEARRVAETVS
jgi:AcrR family transcriptional regulator